MERYLIYYGAATIFGDKAGSMFSIHDMDLDQVLEEIEYYNQLLDPHIHIEQLRHTEKSSLIFIYRRAGLEKIINNDPCRQFLCSLGYRCDGVDCVLRTLIEKFDSLYPSMPHEVGLLLDYPLEDVIGFINCEQPQENRCGYWRSFTDCPHSQTKMAKYKKWDTWARSKYNEGKNLTQLITQTSKHLY